MCPEGCVNCCTYGPDIEWNSAQLKKTLAELKEEGKDVRELLTPEEWEKVNAEIEENEVARFDFRTYCIFTDKDGVFGRRGCLIHDRERPWVCENYNGPESLQCVLYDRTMELERKGLLNPSLARKLPYEHYLELIERLERGQKPEHKIKNVKDAMKFITDTTTP